VLIVVFAVRYQLFFFVVAVIVGLFLFKIAVR